MKLQVSSINRVLRNISSDLSGKAMSDDAGVGGAGGVYDRFGLFAAAANAWNRTNPWYAGSATGCSLGGGGGTCPPGPGAPRSDYHQPHRSAVHHHSPIPTAPSAAQMLVSKKG